MIKFAHISTHHIKLRITGRVTMLKKILRGFTRTDHAALKRIPTYGTRAFLKRKVEGVKLD